MKRKLLLLLVALLPMIASAYQAKIDGIYYDFSGDNATVTYQKYQNYTYKSDYSGEVVIPESVAYNGKIYSVTSIGSYAFRDCTSLTSITIGNSVTSIEDYAFFGCTSLTSITIPNSVTSIGGGAFSHCTSLTSITIPNSVTSIGEKAFYTCTSLTSITIGNSVTSIGDYAFENCGSLTSITIPNSVTSIGIDAFFYCRKLTSITIPNSVTSIGEMAFCSCTSLTSITIPNSVTSIGSGAFSGCSNLTSITIPNSVTSIGNCAFSSCTSLTSIQVETGNTTYDSRDNCNAIIETATNTLIAGCKNTTIPNSVTSIEERAFSGCGSLTSITIPNSVTSIGEGAFKYCASLTSITIPNSVTSIGEMAFYYCSSLTAITIGTGIKDIGNSAFTFCKGLTDVYCFAENVPDTNIDAFYSSSIGSATLHVPASSISSYITTYPWSIFGKIVSLVAEDAVTEVKALPILIQSNRGTITVQGANEGTEVSVFSVNGMKQGSAIATNGLATIYTSLHPGSTAIVKIGEKAIKVMVK